MKYVKPQIIVWTKAIIEEIKAMASSKKCCYTGRANKGT